MHFQDLPRQRENYFSVCQISWIKQKLTQKVPGLIRPLVYLMHYLVHNSQNSNNSRFLNFKPMHHSVLQIHFIWLEQPKVISIAWKNLVHLTVLHSFDYLLGHLPIDIIRDCKTLQNFTAFFTCSFVLKPVKFGTFLDPRPQLTVASQRFCKA